MVFQAAKKTFKDLEDFLDNLPSSPCQERPEGGRYCSICSRVNGPIASDCEYVETSIERETEKGSTFKILGGDSGGSRPTFNIVSGGSDSSSEETQKPISGIEKEYPLIEIVKPDEPSVRPLEMEIIEEETVVFEIADEEEVQEQEMEEELTAIIIQVQPLLGKAAELGLDTSVIQDKIKEGITFLSEKEYEKAGTLLKGIDSAVMMDSILFTQNKLEEVVAKKPGEKTLPRYFAEAGNRFKKKDYLKCLDYLKYVVEQSTKMLKQLEELEKAKKELEDEEDDDEIMVVAIADDDDDYYDEDEIKIEVKTFKPVKKGVKKAKVKGVKKAKGGKKAKVKGVKKAKGVKKVKGVKKAKGTKKAKIKGVKQAKVKGVKTAKKGKPKLAKPKAPKGAKIKQRPLKETPKFKPLTVKEPAKEKKQKPLKVKEPAKKSAVSKTPPSKNDKSSKKKSKKKQKGEEVWELEPLDKPPDLRLKALLSAQKAAERYSEMKDAGEDVADAEKLISKARELLAQEKYDEMITLSNQAMELME
jgi:hypothetical protein